MKRLVWVACLVALLLPAPASAETTLAMGKRIYTTVIKKSSNPARAYARLSSKQRRAVRVYLTPVKKTTATVRRTAMRAAQAGSTEVCSWQTTTVTLHGNAGNVIINFNQRVDWCRIGTRITELHATRWGTTHALFWTYKGTVQEVTWGVGRSTGQAFGQGRFELCVLFGDIGCVDSVNPWVRHTFTNGIVSNTEGGR